MKQNKLIFNFFVNRNWKKLADSRKRAKILADNRKCHHPIETLSEGKRRNECAEWHVASLRDEVIMRNAIFGNGTEE